MIKIKGRKLIFTGKDEKFLIREAKRLKISPKKLVNELIGAMSKRIKIIEHNIWLEKL